MSTPELRYPLTRSQTWVWAGQQLLPTSPLNNMAFAFHLREPLDVSVFTEAVAHLITVCDAMHLRLAGTAEEPRAVFVPPVGPQLEFVDLSATTDPATVLRKELTERTAEPFALAGPLFRTILFKIGPQRFVWYLNQHHLITDGWSKALQVPYVLDTYDALRRGEEPPAANFGTYRAYLENPPQPAPEARAYWDDRAKELPPPPKLFGRGNPERRSAATRQVVQLTAEQVARLEAVCGEPEVRNWSVDLARFTVFATVFFAYLHRVSGQAGITIGVPAHNRVSATEKATPGLFMELFPQSVTVDPEETFASLLQKVRAESMEYLRHAKPGSSTRTMNQTFSSLLNYINRSFQDPGAERLTAEWLHSGHTEPGHHLNLQVYDFAGTGRPTLCFDVNSAVIEPEFHPLIPRQFLDVLEQFLADRTQPINGPGTGVRAQEVVPGSYVQVVAFNREDATYPTDKTVVDLFYATAARHPERTAVTANGESLTYAELDARSNQLAHHLLAAGLPLETPVAICLDRSLEMIVGLLGILKAGGAYVPIDPEFPARRIAYLLEDVSTDWLLTTSHHHDKLRPLQPRHFLSLDADWPTVDRHPAQRPTYRPQPTDLIYVIHTSGSTGRPKGVMNQHNGPMNRLSWALATFQLDPATDVVLQKTTFCFDVSFWEIFWPLVAGAKLVFARPGGHKDDRYLREVIRAEKVTIIHFVPPMLEAFLDVPAELPSLQKIFCSGEALKPHQVNLFRERLPGVELHNLYGPTEAGIEVTHWQAPEEPVRRVPIGRPLPNAPLYILDPEGALCPVGVPGELYIGGVPVARGYFGKPELTAERFVTRQLFRDAEPERLYKTGDLCRWLPSGEIDFLGRIDHQVKVRGYRIELGEIETTLQEMPSVARTQVLARDDGQGSYLVAYLVAGDLFSAELARTFLGERLPAYMIPDHFVTLTDFPLNSNGKIDRAALPAPDRGGIAEAEQTAPAGEFEEILLGLWTEALGMTQLGVTTSFHDLGGHSLSAIRLINRVNEAFGLELPANTIFRFPTIRGLAGHLETVIRQLLEEMNDA